MLASLVKTISKAIVTATFETDNNGGNVEGGFLLLEDGDFLLLEDGGLIETENYGE